MSEPASDAGKQCLPEAGGFRLLLLGSNRIYCIQGHIGDVPSFIIISQIAHPGILRYRGIQKGFHLYLHCQLPQISVIRANGQGIPVSAVPPTTLTDRASGGSTGWDTTWAKP